MQTRMSDYDNQGGTAGSFGYGLGETKPVERYARPVRECKSCGFKTVSTSTIDWCPECKDEDGLRPRHFLTRDKASLSSSKAGES